MTSAKAILDFLFQLEINIPLPDGFEVLNPLKENITRGICKTFYNKYYNDDNKKFCIIGINPGRFGAGITGIPFTDPVRLETDLAIDNPWPKKQELSSVFIYDVINAYGGPEKFYSTFYITAVSPLGFTSGNKNINYYDDKLLREAIKTFAVDCLQRQLTWLKTNVCFCLGEGKNYNYISRLNDEYNFFDRIVPLPHPRFIMQYRLKKKEDFIRTYLKAFMV